MRLLLIALTLIAPAVSRASTWEIDPAHTHVGFAVKHMMVATVRGEFGGVSGTIELDDKDLTKSKIDVTIDAASIDTRTPKRDDDLRSPNFLDVAKFPKITFKSTSIKKSGRGYKVTGELTIHGVTKPVTLDVTHVSAEVANPWGGSNRGFSASTKIKRSDFGMTWNKVLDKGGVLVGDEVGVTLEVEAQKKKEQKPPGA